MWCKPIAVPCLQETFNSLSEDLRAALNRLFWVSLAASITHFVVTLLLFIMGYSPEG
jgi:hypothetical protein